MLLTLLHACSSTAPLLRQPRAPRPSLPPRGHLCPTAAGAQRSGRAQGPAAGAVPPPPLPLQRAPSAAGSAIGGKRSRRRCRARSAPPPGHRRHVLPRSGNRPRLPPGPVTEPRRQPCPGAPRQGRARRDTPEQRHRPGAAESGPTRTCALGPRSAAPETASPRCAAQQPPRPARPSRGRHFRGGGGAPGWPRPQRPQRRQRVRR